jgi:arylsulfatase A-like enzyme
MAHPSATRSSLRPFDFVRISAWTGALTGLMEVWLLAIKKFYLGHLIKVGMDAAWMVPLADAALFLVPGIVAAFVWAWRPRRAVMQTALAGITFLSALSLLLMEAQVALYAKAIVAAGVAVQAARLLSARAAAVQRVVRRTGVWLVAIIVLLGAGVHGWRWWTYREAVTELPPVAARGPNVLLIVMDTVRARSLSLYGYGRATTPNLDRWAERGVVFERALAPSSWTFPSHASLFTGRWPHEFSADWHTPLDGRYPTLAEIFRDGGYLTAGFSANLFYCTSEFGLARGFAHYEDYPVSVSQALVSTSIGRELISFSLNEDFAFRFRNWIGYDEIPGRKRAGAINSGFLRWLGRQDPGRPFFVFLNYLDAHQPFLPPPPFDARFRESGSRGDPRHWWNRQWSAADLKAETDAYDGAIAYVDHELGRLLDELNRRAVLDDTVVIITSDHGEHLGERGYMRHGNTLYPEVLHVPLLILLPKGMTGIARIPDAVSLRDVAATALSVAGAECHGCVPGASLAGYWTAAATPDRRPIGSPAFAELQQGLRIPDRYPNARGNLYSLMANGMHYIVNSNGDEELYEFAADPSRARNLAGTPEQAGVLDRLRSELAALRKDFGRQTAVPGSR